MNWIVSIRRRIRRSSSRDSLPSSLFPRNLFFTPTNPPPAPPQQPVITTSPEIIDPTVPPPGYYDVPLPRAHSFPSLPNLSFTPSSPPSWQPPTSIFNQHHQHQHQNQNQQQHQSNHEYSFPQEYPRRPDFNNNSRRASASSSYSLQSQSSSSRLNGYTSLGSTVGGQELEGEEEDILEIRSSRRRRRSTTTLIDSCSEGLPNPPILHRRKVTDPNSNMTRRLSVEEDADPSSLPTSRESSIPLPTSQLWSILFLFLQSLSVLPSLIGFFYSIHQFYQSGTPQLLASSTTWIQGGKAVGITLARSTRLDWFISGLWSLACAYFSHSLAKGLLRRWLVYYSLLPTVIRVISLQAICWPLTLTTHKVLSFDQPVAAWLICASTAAVSNVIQIWVTSNIVERKDRRGHQRWRVFSVVLSAVLGPPVRTEKFRKSERVLSWKRVLWGTVVPFAILGWITTIALLWQQFLARYKGQGGVNLGSVRLNQQVSYNSGGTSLTGLDRDAEIRIVILVTSSWTNRSSLNRQRFRDSSVLLIPESSSALSITYRFLIGSAPSPQTAASIGPLIEIESEKFGDMLMVPAQDGYSDLSYKVFEGWRWAAGIECDYVLKTDDDIFLRMDVLGKEFIELGRRREYWKGFAYWNIPAIKDATNKNADFSYELSAFPPYTAGALHILSHDLVALIAPPTGSKLFVMNEDQALGLWIYPTGIKPIHDSRIQQAQVCENDMVAKHFGGEYIEESGIGPIEMLANLKEGRKLCEGFLQKWCGVCYASCRRRENHWRDWGFECDDLKGATLRGRN